MQDRPPGVTFACVASIVYGSVAIGLAAVGFLFMLAFAGMFSQATDTWMSFFLWPFAIFAWLGALFAMITLVVFLPLGILGVVAGVQGLKGEAWARWTMVGLFGLGTLTLLSGAAAGFPLPFVALNVVAVVMLVNGPANEWFDRVQAA